jgi:hypothetical protein
MNEKGLETKVSPTEEELGVKIVQIHKLKDIAKLNHGDWVYFKFSEVLGGDFDKVDAPYGFGIIIPEKLPKTVKNYMRDCFENESSNLDADWYLELEKKFADRGEWDYLGINPFILIEGYPVSPLTVEDCSGLPLGMDLIIDSAKVPDSAEIARMYTQSFYEMLNK